MASNGISKNPAVQRVNIGCGSRYLEDWTNLDFVSHSPSVIAHDLSRGVPLPDDSVDFVYSSHVLEHFDVLTGQQLLSECFRILKVGGRARIVVPDTEFLAQNYLTQIAGEKRNMDLPNAESVDYEWSKLALFDQFSRNHSGGEMVHTLASQDEEVLKKVFELEGSEFRDIHKELAKSKVGVVRNQRMSLRKITAATNKQVKHWLLKKLIGPKWEKELTIGQFRLGGEVHYAAYDEVSLGRALMKAGFTSVSRYDADTSGEGNWHRCNLDIQVDGQAYKPNSLYMEGVKE